MVLAGFEPAILAREWTQTHALDGATTGIGYIVQLLAIVSPVFVTFCIWCQLGAS